MKLRKLVVAVAVAALGSLAVASMVRADDADGDGVRNSRDQCANSDLTSIVVIGSCDTGVPNVVDKRFKSKGGIPGCSIMDFVAICLATSTTDKQFEQCVKDVGEFFRDAGLIDGQQARKVFQCGQNLNAL